MSQLGQLRAVSLVDSCDFLPFFHPHSHRPLFFPRVLFMPSPAIMRGRGLGEGPFTAFFTNTRATPMSARFSLTLGRV